MAARIQSLGINRVPDDGIYYTDPANMRRVARLDYRTLAMTQVDASSPRLAEVERHVAWVRSCCGE